MGKIYQVVVFGIKGEKVLLDLCNTQEQMESMTVLQLREKINQRFPEIASAVRLIFTTKQLDVDSEPLSKYGIQHMSGIQMVIKVPGGLTA
uniref:Ubiquitin-like domain-containing protein n=1 Tax=Mola mola TaxID=94237 RepID=A0A3Q4BD74_MOLML